MNEQNPQENRSNIPQQAYYSELDNQEYEINLSALLSGLYTRWRWLAGITFTGTLIAVLIALSSPRAYEVDAHVMQPTKADVAIFNTTGYVNTDNHANWTQQELFNKYYDKLRSQDNFYQFVKTNAWLNKFYPDNASEEEKQLADLYKNLSIEILEPKKKKGELNDLPPSMVGIKFLAKDQVLGSKLINAYIDYTNESLIKNIDDEGIILRDNEQQRIETKITSLRNNAAIKKAVQLVQLTDAYQIASAMEITNPTTIEALTHKGDKVNSQINVGNTDKDILALMGTNYLRNEITALQNRPDSAGLFVEQIPELKQQLASIKTEEDKKQFKALIANDAYIGGYSDLMARFTELSNLTFDFINVKCFSFDKIAKISGNEVKSNKKLIVSLGFVISAMLAVFSVLIMNAKQKQP